MNLDDLAKAACEAEYPFPDDEWDEITDEETKRAWRRTALAVASAVLEAIEAEGIDDIRRNVAAWKESK